MEFHRAVSFPLPRNHCIFQKAGEPPAPLQTVSNKARMEMEASFKEAIRWAIRASTMSGKDMNFDPDAMIQNMSVGLFGYLPKDFPREILHIKKKMPDGKILEIIANKAKHGKGKNNRVS